MSLREKHQQRCAASHAGDAFMYYLGNRSLDLSHLVKSNEDQYGCHSNDHQQKKEHPMTGKGYIIISMDRPIPRNGSFHEHGSIEEARDEAQRLTLAHGGEFVIYEPVLRCNRTPPVQWTVARIIEEIDDAPF